MLNTAGALLPTVFTVIASGAIDAAIFLFAVITFYMEGPKLLNVFANLSPMDDSYETRLFDVFREFAKYGGWITSDCHFTGDSSLDWIRDSRGRRRYFLRPADCALLVCAGCRDRAGFGFHYPCPLA